jgi:hypothetical protein
MPEVGHVKRPHVTAEATETLLSGTCESWVRMALSRKRLRSPDSSLRLSTHMAAPDGYVAEVGVSAREDK